LDFGFQVVDQYINPFDDYQNYFSIVPYKSTINWETEEYGLEEVVGATINCSDKDSNGNRIAFS
jgi:hypothetical protein